MVVLEGKKCHLILKKYDISLGRTYIFGGGGGWVMVLGNYQSRDWILVGQGPTVLAVGYFFLSPVVFFFFFIPPF